MGDARAVADMMTREVVTVNEEDNLADILDGMDRYRFRHIPVVDEGRVVGVISQRDILRCTVSDFERTSVADERDVRVKEGTFVAAIMTREPQTVTEDTPVAEAARLMLEGRFGCLPVVDDRGHLIGIVTEHDMLGELVRALG